MVKPYSSRPEVQRTRAHVQACVDAYKLGWRMGDDGKWSNPNYPDTPSFSSPELVLQWFNAQS